MQKYVSCFARLACLSLLSIAAHATTITITNPGFEANSNNLNSGTVSGWTKVGSSSSGTYNPYVYAGGNVYYNGANTSTNPANGGSGYPGIGGEIVAFIYNGPAGNGFAQTLSATLAANTIYTLTISTGKRNGTGGGQFGGSRLELLAGGTVIASTADSVGPTSGGFETQTATVNSATVSQALLGSALGVRFTLTGSGSTDWDNVALSADPAASTPEPATCILIPSAFAALLLLRRRA